MCHKAIGFFLVTFFALLTACEAPASTTALTPKPTTPVQVATPTPVARPTEIPTPATPGILPSPEPLIGTPAPEPTSKPTAVPTVLPAPTIQGSPIPEATSQPLPPLPTATPPLFLGKGETLSVISKAGRHNLSFTFLWWNAGERAVAPYQGKYYTYIAQPGMKFVIITYRFKNVSNIEEETPDIGAGELLTQPKGYIYKLWPDPQGPAAQVYRPWESFPSEVAQLGASNGGNVKLLPEQTVDGRVIFEVLLEMTPAELTLANVPEPLIFIEQPLSRPSLTPQPVPTSHFLRKGETLPEVAAKSGRRNLSFTSLWWNVRDRAIASYQGTYYTYMARPGMKFVIVTYRFKNVSNIEEETPDIMSGKIVTQPKGYIYELWLTPQASEFEVYRASPSFPRDIEELGGTNGGNVKLLPEQSVVGHAVFQIPEDMSPVEVNLAGIPVPILLTD